MGGVYWVGRVEPVGVTSGAGRSIQKPGKSQDEWIRRLKHANHERTLRGYYEPEDSRERAVARKRYLAPASRLSEREAKILMKDVLEFSPTLLARASGAFSAVGDVRLHETARVDPGNTYFHKIMKYR